MFKLLRLPINVPVRSWLPSPSIGRLFSNGAVLGEKPLPPRIVIPESDLVESFLKGSGPGGQKINKTSSAVQLKHLPTGIVVKSQETRSRAQNRKIARRILSDKLEDLEKGPQSRTALKAEQEKKKKASTSKKARRKYRKLEEDKAQAESDVGPQCHDDSTSTARLGEVTDAKENLNDLSREPVKGISLRS